jgi:hypothetical protein
MTQGQSILQARPFTLAEFEARFTDDSACLDFLKEQKYPAGIAPCAKCGCGRRHHRVRGRRAYACDYCGSMISPAAGTIFEKSSTPLRTWFYAVFRASTASDGLTAKQLQRETGVTYKTAWRMLNRIRGLMQHAAGPEGECPTCGGSADVGQYPTRPDGQLLLLLRNAAPALPAPGARSRGPSSSTSNKSLPEEKR